MFFITFLKLEEQALRRPWLRIVICGTAHFPKEKFGWQVEFHQIGMHTPLKEIENLSDYFSIAFVRNPFEVITSAWNPEQYKDFDQFIEQRILTGLEICGRRFST